MLTAKELKRARDVRMIPKTLAYEFGLIAGKEAFPLWDIIPSRARILGVMPKYYSMIGHSDKGRNQAQRDFAAGFEAGLTLAIKSSKAKNTPVASEDGTNKY